MAENTTTPTDPTDVSPLVSDPLVRELPPSCTLVWFVLCRNDATQKAIIESTGLSTRGVRDALTRLATEGLIDSRPYPLDARQDVYSLVEHD